MVATVQKVVDALLAAEAWRAVKYVDAHTIIRATRPHYGNRPHSRKYVTNIVLTIGRPNYRERAFIKQCHKAGETFPVRKIQLQFKRASKR